MKKTVVFEFPDDFIFPPELIDGCCDLKGIFSCPFYFDGYGEYEPSCRLTGGDKWDKKACPFYNGADTVNYDDC